MLLEAEPVAELKGREGLVVFLRRIAKKDPKGFGAILWHLLLSQLERTGGDNVANAIYQATALELAADLERRGVSIPKDWVIPGLREDDSVPHLVVSSSPLAM